MKFYNESSSLIFKDLVLGKVGVAGPIPASSSIKETHLFKVCFFVPDCWWGLSAKQSTVERK